MSNTKKNRILQLDPAHFRELDGVVFDLESFARHCAPHRADTPPGKPLDLPQDTSSRQSDCTALQPLSNVQTVCNPPEQQAVFAYAPVHIGWYPIEGKGAQYPIMANANLIFGTASGSGSSSYLTSFLSSWQTSWGSYLSSGSFYHSFYSSSSGVLSCAGGYGLELI